MNIATTLRFINFNNGGPWERRFYIMHDYFLMAKENSVGLTAVMSPHDVDGICELSDGLIIPGSGTNVDPSYYGGEPLDPPNEVDEYALDALLIDKFVKAGKPVFGICGGLQAINVYLGGTLRKLDDYLTHQRGDMKTHRIMIEEDSFVHDVFKASEATVNCYHNWEIDRLAPGLRVVARTADGVIEAVEWREKKIFATQWHPEQSYHTGDPIEHRFFENFLELCRRGR